MSPPGSAKIDLSGLATAGAKDVSGLWAAELNQLVAYGDGDFGA